MSGFGIDKELLGRGRSVVLRQSLACVTGSADKALVLGQMIYWQEHATLPGGWFWKSAEQLSVELCALFKAGKVRQLLAGLVQDGLLERMKDTDPHTRRYLYRVCADTVNSRLSGFAGSSATPSPAKEGSSPREDGSSQREEGVITACGHTQEYPNGDEAGDDGRTASVRPLDNSLSSSDAAGPAARPSAAGSCSDDACASAGRALLQALAIARASAWRHLGEEVTKGRTFESVFGEAPSIAWTAAERARLREIADFCVSKWPGLDRDKLTAGFIRATLQADGKPAPIFRYWADFGRGQVSLRPWLALPGKDPERRRDFLLELAECPAVKRFVRRLCDAEAERKSREAQT